MNYLKKLKVKTYPTVRGFRNLKYFFSRFKYGFDVRETWALYDTIDKLLYERLCTYREIASDVINLEFHKIDFKGNKYTLKEAIDLIIEKLETEILSDEPNVEVMEEVYSLYGIIRIYLWW